MTHLAGTAAVARLIVRRDRVRIVVWLAGLAVVVLAVSSSIQRLYASPAELASAASAIETDTAQIALNGPARALDTTGGRVAFEVWNFGLVGVALMSLLTAGRHTRGEEEAGRTELLRATPIGRHAPTAAALMVVTAMNLLVAAGVAAGLAAQGLPVAGSVALATALAATGLVFGALGVLAAQVTATARVAHGIAGALLAVAYGLRAAGDIGNRALSWASPLGWSQATRPFADERWWPVAIAVVAAATLTAASAALTARRDLGAGLVGDRPGPAVAPLRLAGPLGLAWRLQRGSLAAWTAGVFAAGLVFGSVGQDVDDFIGDNPHARDIFGQPGASLADGFFATFLLLLALIAAGYAVSATGRLHSEETTGRAEAVLATPVPRARSAASHLSIAGAGTIVVLAAAGAGMGLAYGIAIGDVAQVPRLVGAAVAYTPAVWTLVGLAAALFGAHPQTLPAIWVALAACVVIALFGQLFDLPDAVADLSPFQHIPRLPATQMTGLPLVGLTATAVVLVAAGIAALRERDLA